MDFSIQEINILIDALKEWRSAPGSNAFSSTLFGTIMMAGREDAEAFRAEAQRDIAKAKMEQRQREEDAIIIQAKLLQMRRDLEATAANEFSATLNERARVAIQDQEAPK